MEIVITGSLQKLDLNFDIKIKKKKKVRELQPYQRRFLQFVEWCRRHPQEYKRLRYCVKCKSLFKITNKPNSLFHAKCLTLGESLGNAISKGYLHFKIPEPPDHFIIKGKGDFGI